MDALRRQQDDSGGFVCFIPLPYLPGNNPLGAEACGPTAMDVLRTMAVARLMLDNIPHIKAYWVMLGLKLAQLCLSSGPTTWTAPWWKKRSATMREANRPRP